MLARSVSFIGERVKESICCNKGGLLSLADEMQRYHNNESARHLRVLATLPTGAPVCGQGKSWFYRHTMCRLGGTVKFGAESRDSRR